MKQPNPSPDMRSNEIIFEKHHEKTSSSSDTPKIMRSTQPIHNLYHSPTHSCDNSFTICLIHTLSESLPGSSMQRLMQSNKIMRRQTDRQTDRQPDRQTDRQDYRHRRPTSGPSTHPASCAHQGGAPLHHTHLAPPTGSASCLRRLRSKQSCR